MTNNDFPSLLDPEKQEGNVFTTPQATSHTSEAPKKEVFSKFPSIVCVDRMLPSTILVSFILDFSSCNISNNFWEPLF